MENWRFVLFFAATFFSITAAHRDYGYGFLSHPHETKGLEPIEVVYCKFYSKRNAKAHHTEMYDLLDEKNPSPILRRGQLFQMGILFSRSFNLDSDSVVVELTLGSKGMKKRGPPVSLPVTPKKEFTHKPSNWDIRLSSVSKSSKYLILQIQIPYTASVGIWRMKVISKRSGGNKPSIHDCNKDVYILFNPWSKGDLVYMEDDIGKQEYVLNDEADIYQGTYKSHHSKTWNFAQFNRIVLPTTIFILERAQNLDSPYLDFSTRGDPIKVISAIAAMANVDKNDTGVVIGKWKPPYENETRPWDWTGSEPILRRYMQSGGQGVKYGQCWVFAAVATTMCKALGLPCRCVTGFEVATDTDDDLVIKRKIFDDGSVVNSTEKSWNFHVWNEVWMKRPELPDEFSGWQAFDGTWSSGPAPVEAIRRGEITIENDSKTYFMFINCEKYYILVDRKHPDKEVIQKIDTAFFGKILLTMEPISRKEDDIILAYKQPEGTPEERKVYFYARSQLGIFKNVTKRGKSDVCFKLRDIPRIMIGKKFKIFVDVENKSSQNRTISFTLTISSVYYTGNISSEIKKDKGNFILQPSQKRVLALKAGPKEYLPKMEDYLMLRVYAQASVHETKQTWATEDYFQFSRPPLKVEYHETIRPKLGQGFNIAFTFRNPLNVVMEDCTLIVEGIGLIEFTKIPLNDLGAGEVLTHTQRITPTKVGSHRLVAVLTSRQITAVLASKQVNVER